LGVHALRKGIGLVSITLLELGESSLSDFRSSCEAHARGMSENSLGETAGDHIKNQ